MNDMISRQSAIGAMKRLYDEDLEAYGCEIPEMFNLNRAIEALKELPSVQPESCGDAVSRNAIIRALNTMDRYVSDELTLCNTDRKFPKNEVFIVDDVYEEIAENLPSVQQPKSELKIAKITDLVEGTIDHLDKDDAIDLLYQIKGVLN